LIWTGRRPWTLHLSYCPAMIAVKLPQPLLVVARCTPHVTGSGQGDIYTRHPVAASRASSRAKGGEDVHTPSQARQQSSDASGGAAKGRFWAPFEVCRKPRFWSDRRRIGGASRPFAGDGAFSAWRRTFRRPIARLRLGVGIALLLRSCRCPETDQRAIQLL